MGSYWHLLPHRLGGVGRGCGWFLVRVALPVPAGGAAGASPSRWVIASVSHSCSTGCAAACHRWVSIVVGDQWMDGGVGWVGVALCWGDGLWGGTSFAWSEVRWASDHD